MIETKKESYLFRVSKALEIAINKDAKPVTQYLCLFH
jgi:hypothetical protein